MQYQPAAIPRAGHDTAKALEVNGLSGAQVPLLLHGYDWTGLVGADRLMRSRATCRHTWQRAGLTGRPKLWA